MRWIVFLALLAACGAKRSAPEQPIAFNHAIHTRVQLDGATLSCTFCHAGAEKGLRAGLPSLQTCLRCHMRPQGDPPGQNDQPVRAAAKQGGAFAWTQVTHAPGHVYFPHGMHVTVGKMQCADCHGDVSSWKTPPTQPVEGLIDMDHCMSCHRDRGGPTYCEACHQ